MVDKMETITKYILQFRINPLMVCALTGNFILCCLGLLVMPASHSATELRMDLQKPALILLLMICVASALLFLSLMAYFAGRNRNSDFIKDFPGHLADSGKFAVFYLVAMLAYAIFCGVIASVLYLVLNHSLQYESIKWIVNITTFLISIGLAPVMLMMLLSFSLSRLPVRDAIRAGLKGAKLGYKRLLLITVAFFIAGTILFLVTNQISNEIIKGIVTLLIYTPTGAAGTYIIYKTGMDVYRNRPQKNGSRTISEEDEGRIPLGFTPTFKK